VFHRVLSVQLTMVPQFHSEERTSDDDIESHYSLSASLRRDSVEGATVAVH